ncbi:hypothetical protein [Nonomuraea sp. JJY05]|uniref:hypothetical protein n=1 Tax=Nonomuraea sp. JJY05 TaxID=3350255 RepID=UPI00373E2645
MRFAEDFSGDIIAAVNEVRPFVGTRKRARNLEARYAHRRAKGPHGGLYPDIVALLDRLRAEDRGLPRRRNARGELELDWPHLAKLLDSAVQGVENSPHRRLFTTPDLPIIHGASLHHDPVSQGRTLANEVRERLFHLSVRSGDPEADGPPAGPVFCTATAPPHGHDELNAFATRPSGGCGGAATWSRPRAHMPRAYAPASLKQ